MIIAPSIIFWFQPTTKNIASYSCVNQPVQQNASGYHACILIVGNRVRTYVRTRTALTVSFPFSRMSCSLEYVVVPSFSLDREITRRLYYAEYYASFGLIKSPLNSVGIHATTPRLWDSSYETRRDVTRLAFVRSPNKARWPRGSSLFLNESPLTSSC